MNQMTVPFGNLADRSMPQPQSEPTEQAAGQPLQLSWQWPRGIVGLALVNFVLRLVTLGAYHFWGKTEVRRRIWSAVRINGEPLTYSGTGLELFLGFIVVSTVVFVPIAGVYLAAMFYFGSDSWRLAGLEAAMYVPLTFLIGLGMYRALRFRMARTHWRGIRGSLGGHSGYYAWTFLWTLALVPATLGWIWPWRATRLQALQVSNMRFGNHPLRFEATAEPLYAPFALLWFGALLIYGGAAVIVVMIAQSVIRTGAIANPFALAKPDKLGLVVLAIVSAVVAFRILSAWYRARMFNHFSNNLVFEGARFRGRATTAGLIWISLTNSLIMLLGVAAVAAVAGAVAYAGWHAMGADLQTLSPETIEQLRTSVITAALLVVALGTSLLSPVTEARYTGYLVRHLDIEGHVALAGIGQAAGGTTRIGEGLAQAFDLDAF